MRRLVYVWGSWLSGARAGKGPLCLKPAARLPGGQEWVPACMLVVLHLPDASPATHIIGGLRLNGLPRLRVDGQVWVPASGGWGWGGMEGGGGWHLQVSRRAGNLPKGGGG